MAKDFAADFYNSRAWKDTRRAYAASVGNLCERCAAAGIVKPGAIVHHKVELTPENISDPSVALAWSNLMLLCRDCHAELHSNYSAPRWKLDELGRVLF